MKETDRTPNRLHPSPEASRLGQDHIAPHDSGNYVTDEVRAEVVELKRQGIDVEIVHYGLEGHYQLDDETQARVDEAIAAYSKAPELIQKGLREASPAVSGWLDMANAASPLALTFFYNTGNMERPSDGLSKLAILDTPLTLEGDDEKKTASQLVRDLMTDVKAEATLQRVERFFEAGSMKEEVDGSGLTAHDLMAGSLDRKADITRAKALESMALEHILPNSEQYENQGVVTISLACGAAEPVYWLVKALESQGIKVDSVNLVDQDPIALAASADRSGYYDLKDKIKLYRKNLLRGGFDKFLPPKSGDIVDMIGIIEYFEAEWAEQLLKNAKSIVKPGGMIIFGNMLKSRPQQEWFNGLWPQLQQRSISEVIEIIEKAGYSRDQVVVRIAEDGLYAEYGLIMPDEVPDMTRNLGHAASPAILKTD